jgi:hypothetical protein
VNAFWAYFWPPFGAGIAVAIIAGAFAFRRPRKRILALALGVILALGLAALWHGPGGAANRFTKSVEQVVREALVNNEIPEVSGHLQRGPLTRRVLLSGPADDFQRREVVNLMNVVPGVESASWSGGTAIPLIAEGGIAAILGFLLGLLVAYLMELRRRFNAQWNW